MRVHRVVFAGIIYGLFALAVGSTYVIVQHDGRSVVEDAPRALPSGEVVGQPARVDLARSQGAFWTRYDRTDRPLDGNGYLRDELADPPPGVLDTARERGSDAVTWEPSAGLRFAIVAQREPHGEVLMAGQSLSRTEERAAQSLIITLSVLIAGAVITGAGLAVSALVSRDSAAGGRPRLIG
jgi:hypothetical protein